MFSHDEYENWMNIDDYLFAILVFNAYGLIEWMQYQAWDLNKKQDRKELLFQAQHCLQITCKYDSNTCYFAAKEALKRYRQGIPVEAPRASDFASQKEVKK